MNGKILMGTLLMAACITLAVTGIAYGDRDGWGEEDEGGLFSRQASIARVTSKLYASECGACHFAYQPGWLPARSWQRMMNTLDDHFGENAELDDQERDSITRYLVANAADRVPNRQSRRILRSLRGGEPPLRISELRYIRHEHDEIPGRAIEGNPKVRSRSNCQTCHTQADKGYFD
jgi:mono/diheme cytochrome c family protein